jgi:hypothetical protein
MSSPQEHQRLQQQQPRLYFFRQLRVLSIELTPAVAALLLPRLQSPHLTELQLTIKDDCGDSSAVALTVAAVARFTQLRSLKLCTSDVASWNAETLTGTLILTLRPLHRLRVLHLHDKWVTPSRSRCCK